MTYRLHIVRGYIIQTTKNIRLERFNEIQSQQGVHSHLGKAILIKRRYARGI